MKTGRQLSVFILVLTLAGMACNFITRGFDFFQPDNAKNPGSQLPEQNLSNGDTNLGADVEEVHTTVLESQAFLNNSGWVDIIGMIENTGSETIDFINVTASLLDQSGALLSTESTYTFIDVLEPGKQTPFKVSFFDVPDGWTDFDILVEAELNEYWVSYKDFEVLSDNGFMNDFGDYVIAGEIRNSGSKTVTFIQIITAFYDSSGKLVGADLSFADLEILEPGGTTPFTVTLFSMFAMKDGPEVASHQLWVQGYLEE